MMLRINFVDPLSVGAQTTEASSKLMSFIFQALSSDESGGGITCGDPLRGEAQTIWASANADVFYFTGSQLR